jgi:hypothetical protein
MTRFHLACALVIAAAAFGVAALIMPRAAPFPPDSFWLPEQEILMDFACVPRWEPGGEPIPSFRPAGIGVGIGFIRWLKFSVPPSFTDRIRLRLGLRPRGPSDAFYDPGDRTVDLAGERWIEFERRWPVESPR